MACGGAGGSHGTAGSLTPECIAELDDVIPHYKGKSGDEGIGGYVSKAVDIGTEVPSDFPQGGARFDVGVHSNCIGGEQGGRMRDVKVDKLLFQSKRTLEIGVLLRCDEL